MTYIEGDILSPIELVLPDATEVRGQSGAMTVSGALLFVSGAKLWFNHEGNLFLITSS